MLHASSPHSVALMQLRFTSLTVVSSREDLHLQECAHAGRTTKKEPASGSFSSWKQGPYQAAAASFSFFSGRTLTLTLAGLAGNQRSSPENGSLPKRFFL